MNDEATTAAPHTGSSAQGPTRGPHPASGFGRALALTVAGTVVPGVAFLASGRRRLGAVVLVLFLLLVGGAVWLATSGQRDALHLAVDSTALLWLIGGAVGLALLWLVVVLTGYRALLPRGTRGWQRALGGLVVLLLCAAVVAPAAAVVRIASAQRSLVDNVFDDGDSATVAEPTDTSVPFDGKDEINVLLLGGDGGAGREGVRTDTVIVANVQVATGATTLFSLPRNLENLPFPADSPLAAVYPDGFEAGSESESLLNAVYRNGPAAHPDVLGPTDDPGADFLKLGVGEALGLDIDYYLLVNLDGFSRLVDALGGITLNVNYYVPVNGDTATGALPDAYISPGPDQHMSGTRALDYARGRYGLSDYLRMDRQRCVLQAIVDAADPVTLLSQYQDLARTTQDIVSTDVPSAVLGDVVDLAFDVKSAGIRSVVFDDTVINPAYPDYPKIRALVQQALDPAPAATPSSSAPAPATPSAPLSAAPSPGGNGGSVTEVADACAYDPAQAQAALAAGQPPTRGG
ncbi:Cell envelope-related function transcriptional attenuator common domain [Modestobacter italicus]|uniref:Cell envelope-related function transcriptional attenuator common domain n=1 Tax=Modestobacter italicus (strain DSM 44449 / CECT 9708 / BC 501) TaxID=2732864 RepID=I4F5F0_MODI5|nr:LCP family protein [Modestobacter marinus]CCH90863.1 Cell envelope-related function transcriptional attenuator common domain [Modestobacter marinus]